MSLRRWKYLLDPLTGQFAFVAVPLLSIFSGAGGSIAAGQTTVNTGCTLSFYGGLDILSGGTVYVEPGGTLVIQ